MAPSVGGLQEITQPRLVFGSGNHAVVIGVSDVLPDGDVAPGGIGIDLYVRRLISAKRGTVDDHLRLVVILEQPQLVARAALVIHFERKALADFSLDTHVVLIHVGAANV